jgi:hypothetical protein
MEAMEALGHAISTFVESANAMRDAWEHTLGASQQPPIRASVGDDVYVKADQDTPFVAKVAKVHGDEITLRWYLRPSDLRAYVSKKAAEAYVPAQNELVLSDVTDDNSVGTIIGRCDIKPGYHACSYFCISRVRKGAIVRL